MTDDITCQTGHQMHTTANDYRIELVHHAQLSGMLHLESVPTCPARVHSNPVITSCKASFGTHLPDGLPDLVAFEM